MNTIESKEYMEATKELLRECNTLEEVFATIENLYDCSEPLGFVAKQALITNISKLIKITRLNPLMDEDEQ